MFLNDVFARSCWSERGSTMSRTVTTQTATSKSMIARRDAAPPTTGTAAAQPAPPARASWTVLKKTAPSVAIVALLAALAFWGHKSDWTLPKLSTLLGQSESPDEEWCKAHNVAEAMCIECNSSLVPPEHDYGWCKIHGVAQCPFEHPEVAQLKTTPTISPADTERAAKALALRPRPENSSRCKLHLRRVQFASIEALDKAGVDIAVVSQRAIIEAVTAPGEVTYDQTRTAHLASRVTGTVSSVLKQVGDRVQAGDLLALVDSAEVGRGKSELLQAISQYRLKKTNVGRLTPLFENGSVPERNLREADAALEQAHIQMLSAQQHLVNLGLDVDVDQLEGLDAAELSRRVSLLGVPADALPSNQGKVPTSNLFPLRSPLDGVVIARNVVAGEIVGTSTMLFGVADLRTMWLTLDVRQDDAKYLALGQKVLFRSSDSEEAEITGALAWISTEADDETRTVKVRVDLPNEDGRLRANTFGVGRIVLREEPRAIVVPTEAIHRDGCCDVVFVRDKDFLQPESPKYFHIRKVRLGVKSGDATEIIAGVLPGEVIASKNSVVLEAQLLKSNLGAGCGCCAPEKN